MGAAIELVVGAWLKEREKNQPISHKRVNDISVACCNIIGHDAYVSLFI